MISTHATVNKYSIPRLIYLMDSRTPEVSICSPGLTNDQFSKSHFNLRVYLACLLYTSDAADDMQCVDLGGRRIIKKLESVRVRS